MAQLHDLTLTEQAAAVRAREVSPVALVSHYLARIDRYDQTLRSFVTLTPDTALDAAKVAERAVMNGDPLPPLHGVPIAFKDLTPTAGVRTTFGSAAFADFVPDYDHDVVRLLREAGTISLGKTATSEFGCSLYTETRLGPPTRNPWRTDLIPGGSSGGAAAAVAAGLVPAAQGSDGGGSLRIPASLCGLVGYKPTRGLVPGGPLGFGAFGLPTQGPLGRTVADVAILLEVMSAPQPGEPYVPPPQFRAAALHNHIETLGAKSLTIGRYATPILGHAPVDPAVLAVWDDASRLLADLGHTVEDVEAPFDEAVLPEFEVLWSALSLSPVPPGTEELLLPLTRWLRERGAATPVAAVLAALNSLQSRVRRAMRALDGYDLLLSPVLAGVGAEVGSFAALDPAEDFRRQAEFSPFCAAYNLTGQPAVSLPLGWSPDGLPIGVMLAARPGRDVDLLAVAGRLEQARDWVDRHPDTWRG